VGKSALLSHPDDRFRLDGRVALITGASRGIGAAIARTFVEAGAEVALVARSRPELERVAGELDGGRRVSLLVADVSNLSAAPSLVADAVARHDRLDILVNNAGGAMPASLQATDPAQLEAAFRLNVSAAFSLTKSSRPHLLASEHGSVINITSMMDRFAAPDHLTYATVKAALSHLTRALAIELAPRVRVNAVAPSIVETDALRAALSDEDRARLVAATPLQRLATVQDVADATRWLASPAASFITAKVIEVDGGIQGPIVPGGSPGPGPATGPAP
jgi:7-alpha-hydroxysteroid dehydrogenase